MQENVDGKMIITGRKLGKITPGAGRKKNFIYYILIIASNVVSSLSIIVRNLLISDHNPYTFERFDRRENFLNGNWKEMKKVIQ